MRKVIKFTVLIACLVVYIISLNQSFSDKIEFYRINHTGFFSSDRYIYGDLYGMSHLSWFRKQFRPDTPIKYSDCAYQNKIDLYAEADSYIWPIFTIPQYYCGVDKLTYVRNMDGYISGSLDTTKVNVLLLEFSERNLLKSMIDSTYVNNLVSIQSGRAAVAPPQSTSNSLRARITSALFNKRINENLGNHLWDYTFFRPVKELKADLDYHLFNKVDVNVGISANGRQLYYAPTIDTGDIVSAFRYIPERQKDAVVSGLNKIYDKARQCGFSKVYLTIVPNPISILDPHYQGLHYNNLLNRVQNDPKLKMPYINLWPGFELLQHQVYQASDSHWNHYGASLWLQKFNAELSKAILSRN